MKKCLLMVAVVLLLSAGAARAADFNGDGTEDIGIFRPGSGLWVVRGVTRVYFGSGNDSPQSADFSGDGTDEIAVFRPTTGLWAVRGITRAYYGQAGDSPLGAGGARTGIFTPGDIIIADTGLYLPDAVTSETYEKVAEIQLGQGGSVRVLAGLSVYPESGSTAYGRVYRNGAPVGAEWTATTDNLEAFSQDIGGWMPGDACQLYMKTNDSGAEGVSCIYFAVSVGPGPYAGLTFSKGVIE